MEEKYFDVKRNGKKYKYKLYLEGRAGNYYAPLGYAIAFKKENQNIENRVAAIEGYENALYQKKPTEKEFLKKFVEGVGYDKFIDELAKKIEYSLEQESKQLFNSQEQSRVLQRINNKNIETQKDPKLPCIDQRWNDTISELRIKSPAVASFLEHGFIADSEGDFLVVRFEQKFYADAVKESLHFKNVVATAQKHFPRVKGVCIEVGQREDYNTQCSIIEAESSRLTNPIKNCDDEAECSSSGLRSKAINLQHEFDDKTVALSKKLEPLASVNAGAQHLKLKNDVRSEQSYDTAQSKKNKARGTLRHSLIAASITKIIHFLSSEKLKQNAGCIP